MVSAQKIKYNGIFSDTGLGDLDIILDVSFDSDNGAMSTYLNRSAIAAESHDGRYKNTTRYKYDELFSPQFTIVKRDFSDFTQEQARRVLKYLTSTDKPALLEVYYDGDSNVVDWACIGGWTNIETYKIANSRTVGIVAQFEAITPYAMSRLYDITRTISSVADNKIIIKIDTDDNRPVCPRVTINHGYNPDKTSAVSIPHTVVELPGDVEFNNITDMADYVENTIYRNAATGTYYYKSYTPQFTSRDIPPEYAGWTTVEVDRAYTRSDTFAEDTFYHYAYAGMYYWKMGGNFHEESSRPVYGDWKIKDGTKVYTASDDFEYKTVYLYNDIYYWMAPYNFYKSSTQPTLSTTSVKITNQHYDLLNKPSVPVVTIIKNNTGTEKIVLDGENKIVSSDRVRRIFGDDFNLQHLELYDGTNEITIEGNCEVVLEYRTAIKIGEY